jgi:uncharacterized protein (TIGR00255 family)
MNSMTGYGMASICIGSLDIEIEVTSVNKRHIETIISAPKEWQRFEYDATKQIKSLFERGRIRAAINLIKNSGEEEEGFFEESIIEEDLERLESFLRKRNQAFEVTPELILRLADLRKNQTKLPPLEKVRNELENTLSEACKNMAQMRQKEGLAIKGDLLARIYCIRDYISQMDELSYGMAQEHKDKLMERLKKSNLSLEQDDDRILKEVALFAEKSDTSEEITRLKSHLSQMQETLEVKGCMGRKIEFLLQEISRELNTFCSKSTRTQCTNIALNARTEVEKMREQSLNIE